MQKSGKIIIYLGIFVLGITLFGVIPRQFLDVYMSPDETAVAVSAKHFVEQGNMKIEDALLLKHPWLHPRSFVAQGGYMVPVGFLGLPLIMALVLSVFGQFGLLWVTPLLALSAAVPLWKIVKKMGPAAQISAALAWLTFPTVVLYANRGLFPNLVVLSLVIWATYLIWMVFDDELKCAEWARKLYLCAAGLMLGAAVAIRPVEAAWIVVWVFALLMVRRDAINKTSGKFLKGTVFLIAAAVVPVVSAWMAYKTYGSFFAIGYNLRDTVLTPQPSGAAEVSQNLLPFGLHPRAMLSNYKFYLLGMYWPWLAASVFALFVGRKDRIIRITAGAGVMTAMILSVVYGQALYQDHVGVDIVSIGNSFLRYFLPLTPFFVLAIAALVRTAQQKLGRVVGTSVTVVLVILVSSYGAYLGLYQDGEGAAISAQELLRYSKIRNSVEAIIPDHAAILSERSDKVFFPQSSVASPLPEDDRIKELVAQERVLIFLTTQDTDGLVRWQERGFDLLPLFSSSNQTLYEMSL